MNYKSKENVHQVLTAITVKRLSAYARLCELYSQLAEIMVNEEGRAQVTPADIEQRYSAILSSVAYNDLDEESYNKIVREGYFSEKEVDIFKSFSETSKNFIDFTNGFNILKKSISKDSDEVDQEVVDDYLDFMQNKAQNDSTEHFVEYIRYHTPAIIGKNYYHMYNRALSRIKEVDDSHLNIPQFDSVRHFSREMFGTTTLRNKPISINELLSKRNRKQVSIDDTILDEASELYDRPTRVKFRRSITPREKITDHAHAGKTFISDTIREIKHPIRTLAVGAGVMILTGCLLTSALHKNHSQMPATKAYEQGIELDVSEETVKDLESIQEEIDRLSSSSTIPTYRELNDLKDHLDEVNSDVAQELTASGFKKAHPEYSNISVGTAYRDSSDGRDIAITITYTDEKGEEQTFNVSQIDADFNQSFNREDSYSSVLPDMLDELSKEDVPFDEKVTLVKKYLGKCQDLYDGLDKFAGMDAEYKDITLFGSKISANKKDPNEKKDVQDSNEIPDKDDDPRIG